MYDASRGAIASWASGAFLSNTGGGADAFPYDTAGGDGGGMGRGRGLNAGLGRCAGSSTTEELLLGGGLGGRLGDGLRGELCTNYVFN